MLWMLRAIIAALVMFPLSIWLLGRAYCRIDLRCGHCARMLGRNVLWPREYQDVGVVLRCAPCAERLEYAMEHDA